MEIKNIELLDGLWYESLALWAAAADGSGSIEVARGDDRLRILEWISPSRFLAYHFDSGPLPGFGLELIDLHVGTVQTYYPGTVLNYAIDPATRTVAFTPVTHSSRPNDTLQAGLYLVSPSQRTPRLVHIEWAGGEYEDGWFRELSWSLGLDQFEFTLPNDRRGRLTTDGIVTLCEEC